MVILDTLSGNTIAPPTAVALGYFDGVHLGHRAVISAACACRAQGLAPCVFSFSVSTRNPGSGKGRLNIMTDTLKSREIGALGAQYYAVPDFSEFMELSPLEFVRLLVQRLGARSVFCGANFRFGKGASGDAALLRTLCEEQGARLTIVPDVMLEGLPVSSSRIRTLLGQGEMGAAARLLGRPYSYDFAVAPGRRLGRSIGVPTINQYFESGLLVPRHGVYASFVRLEGRVLPCVTDIGVRPTVDENSPPLSETCILGYDGDLYGQRVEVRLLRFLRPETRFASVEELKRAIGENIAQVRGGFDRWFAEIMRP